MGVVGAAAAPIIENTGTVTSCVYYQSVTSLTCSFILPLELFAPLLWCTSIVLLLSFPLCVGLELRSSGIAVFGVHS